MDSYPANSFFNNFTNLFNRIEKTEGTPVISSFRFLSGKNTEPQNISTQKPHTITYETDSPVEKDLDGIDVFSQINSRTQSETKVFTEAEVVLAKTNKDKCISHNNLDQRSSQGQVMNEVETNINARMDKDDVEIQVSPTHTGKKFLDMDPQVSMDQGNLWKDSSLTCQNDQRVADSHLLSKADLQSKAFSQEYNNTSMSNTAPADNHRIGDLSKCISKQTATNITNEKTLSTPQYEGKCQEWTNEVKRIRTKTQEPSDVNENEELYTERTSETSSTDVNNPVSTIAVSDQADKAMSTFKSNLDIPNGGFGTNTACADSDTGNNKIQPKEEFWSFSSPDTYNGCHVESDKQFSSETGDVFSKLNSDRVLLNLEPTTPDIFNKTQKGTGTNNIQELSKLEMKKNGGQDRQIVMKVKSNDQVQIEGENTKTEIKEEKNYILQKDSISEFLGIPSAPGKLEEPLHIKNASRSTRRITFSPGLKLEKPPSLPSIFNGLKGLKKEVHDQQKIASGLEQPKSPVLMKPASVKRALYSEKHHKVEVKGSILEQLSQLLNFDAGKTGAIKTQEPTASPPLSPISKAPESEMPSVEEIVEGPDVASSEESNKITNTETALNAFKAFFSPKPAKRDTSDLDAVKRAFNPETIRAIFDRNSSKSPDNRNISTTKVCTKKLLVKARFYLEMITFSRYLKFLIRTF